MSAVESHIDRWKLFQEGGPRCAWCACPLEPDTATRDHLIPRARKAGRRGGANIAPACVECNGRRGCMRLDRWIGRCVVEHGALPESTVRMLLCLLVEHPRAAHGQGLNLALLAEVPGQKDVRMPFRELGSRYRALEREKLAKQREKVAEKRAVRTLAGVE